MKITITDVAEHGSISAAIEAKAQESDSIASGIIGPSFACSGPGSGWQKNYDVTDYAKRALSDDYGAGSYIDSSDGTEATLDEDGEDEDGEGVVVWSEESVVEIVLPSVAEALDDMDAYKEMTRTATHYGADADEWEELDEKVEEPYVISDGNATERASTLAEAEEIVEDWYDFLVDDGKVDSLPAPELDSSSLDALADSIRKWENEIAEAMGVESWAGHGNYYVHAADRAGLSLSVSVRED